MSKEYLYIKSLHSKFKVRNFRSLMKRMICACVCLCVFICFIAHACLMDTRVPAWLWLGDLSHYVRSSCHAEAETALPKSDRSPPHGTALLISNIKGMHLCGSAALTRGLQGTRCLWGVLWNWCFHSPPNEYRCEYEAGESLLCPGRICDGTRKDDNTKHADPIGSNVNVFIVFLHWEWKHCLRGTKQAKSNKTNTEDTVYSRCLFCPLWEHGRLSEEDLLLV